MSQPNGNGRIAIKFGSNTTSKPSARPAPPSALGKRSRAQPWGGDDSDSDNDHDGRTTHEEITGFGTAGAENEAKKPEVKKELVIARQANKDWRNEARSQKRGRHVSPGAEHHAKQKAGVANVETEPADQDKGIKWGLTITKKDEATTNGDANGLPETATEGLDTKNDEEAPAPARTADDGAIDALMGKTTKEQKEFIIPAATEESAYQTAVASAGEASTLDDYEAMPVEEFGAALLRGMGWDGKERAPARKPVVRRPNRMGLGAKELKDAEDLGAWNQNGGKKRRDDKRPPKLSDYRREEEKKREGRRREDSYKQERDRERERDRHGGRHRSERDRDERDYRDDRHRDRHRGYDRDDRDRRR